MPQQDDGGVAAKLAEAKAALTGASNSNVSPTKSPYAPPPSYAAPHAIRKGGGPKPPAPKPGVSGEVESAAAGLAAKQKNVDDYKAANQ
jgi:hypothetical protein